MIASTAFLLAAHAAVGAPPPAVRVERRASFSAVVRRMKGDYSQHAAAISGLIGAARSSCGAQGTVFGIYPQDPDAVPAAGLQWQLGYRMSPGVRCAAEKMPDGYAVEAYAGETVAVLDSTLAESKAAGLSIYRWLADSGYAQVAPTRMEYFGSGAADTRVQILVPVRKRTWAGARHLER
jgi:hypothetical protein